jgi:hypothetical protein
MWAAIILVTALVALVRFAVWYWRALIATVAAQPVSDRLRSLIPLVAGPMRPGDFDLACAFYQLCPAVESNPAVSSHMHGRLTTVRVYFRILARLRALGGYILPALSSWADREMGTCSRYAAVLVDQRLSSNLEAIARVHSY